MTLISVHFWAFSSSFMTLESQRDACKFTSTEIHRLISEIEDIWTGNTAMSLQRIYSWGYIIHTTSWFSQVRSESFINNPLSVSRQNTPDRRQLTSLHYPKVRGKQTLTTLTITVWISFGQSPASSGCSDWFSRRMWDWKVWQLLKIKWQFLMGFQTSASHCILPSP